MIKNFKLKAERESNTFIKKIMSTSLNTLNNNFEIMPVDKMCDFYLPDSKKAIIILRNSLKSVATGELNPSNQFAVKILKNLGLEVIFCDFDTFNKMVEQGSQDVLNYLTSLSKNILT
jgi:hypothetical protein